MVAKHLSVLPGTFSRHVMNLHIYDRHIAQASELLSRAGSDETPELLLNVPSGTNFYDIQPEDFELVNYHRDKKQLKFELGVWGNLAHLSLHKKGHAKSMALF